MNIYIKKEKWIVIKRILMESITTLVESTTTSMESQFINGINHNTIKFITKTCCVVVLNRLRRKQVTCSITVIFCLSHFCFFTKDMVIVTFLVNEPSVSSFRQSRQRTRELNDSKWSV